MALEDARIKIINIHWYVPHYTPSIPQQGILCKQILSKTTTELRYVERSVFMKEITNQALWNFEFGSQQSMTVFIWIIIGFQERNRQNSQNWNNDRFCSLPVTSALWIIGTEIYPDADILLNYDDDEHSQGYAQFKIVFTALAKDDILQPCISDDNFRFSNTGVVEIFYTLYVFDIKIRKSSLMPNQLK